MEINFENAMKLWNERYQKSSKVYDFSGRQIIRSAYNNTNSEYGWKLLTIYPENLGGKITPSNLVCANIKTINEKKNSYPEFKANGINFSIEKERNYYVIEKVINEIDDIDFEKINFYDPKKALSLFEACKNGHFAGFIKIFLNNVKEIAIVDFIQNMFNEYELDIEKENIFGGEAIVINVKINNIETKEELQDILDDCVMARTYLNSYFIPKNVLQTFTIFFNVVHNDYHINIKDIKEPEISGPKNKNTIVINDMVKLNTDANTEGYTTKYGNTKLYSYNITYTKLQEELKELLK